MKLNNRFIVFKKHFFDSAHVLPRRTLRCHRNTDMIPAAFTGRYHVQYPVSFAWDNERTTRFVSGRICRNRYAVLVEVG